MTDSVPPAAPITDAASAPPAQSASPSVPEWWRQPASVVPSGRSSFLLLEREAQVAALQALTDAAQERRWAVRRHRGKCRHRQDSPARRGAGDRRLGGDASARRPRRRVRGRVCVRDRPSAVRAAARVRRSGSPRRAALRACRAHGAAVRSLASSPPHTDAPAEGSFAILHGLYWLAANVAFQQPTLLAIDDLHWADTASLRWLLYLTRRLEGVPLLVAAGTRPPEGEGRNPTLVAELIADPEAAAIRPEPLGRASIAVLARELHGLRPDEAFCAALETATGGNPLFIGAVLDAVAREGTSPTAEHVPRLLEIGAQGVSRAVGLRLARLPHDGAGPSPRGLDPRRRDRAAPRGRACRRGGRRAWSGRRHPRSA